MILAFDRNYAKKRPTKRPPTLKRERNKVTLTLTSLSLRTNYVDSKFQDNMSRNLTDRNCKKDPQISAILKLGGKKKFLQIRRSAIVPSTLFQMS